MGGNLYKYGISVPLSYWNIIVNLRLTTVVYVLLFTLGFMRLPGTVREGSSEITQELGGCSLPSKLISEQTTFYIEGDGSNPTNLVPTTI